VGMDECIGKFREAANFGGRLPLCHQDPQIEVVPFAADTIAAAVRLYEARDDKNWSLTDCLSFLVMEQRHVLHALTTDRHFEQASFEAILLDDPPGISPWDS
jgi:hypothetical protein